MFGEKLKHTPSEGGVQTPTKRVDVEREVKHAIQLPVTMIPQISNGYEVL